MKSFLAVLPHKEQFFCCSAKQSYISFIEQLSWKPFADPDHILMWKRESILFSRLPADGISVLWKPFVCRCSSKRWELTWWSHSKFVTEILYCEDPNLTLCWYNQFIISAAYVYIQNRRTSYSLFPTSSLGLIIRVGFILFLFLEVLVPGKN